MLRSQAGFVLALVVAGCAGGEQEATGAGGGGGSFVGQHDATMDVAILPEADAAPPPQADGAPDPGEAPDGGTGEECADGAERPCPDGACARGVQRCERLRWQPCTGPAESCNDHDDDCDGEVDEDFPTLGAPCTVGMGACEGAGVHVCNPDGTQGDAVVCNAVPAAEPAVEVCNTLDDDCNGLADDFDGLPIVEICYTGPEGTRGVGECAAGTSACVDGAFGGECVDQVLPTAEVCNDADDDCDGRIDEGDDGGPIAESCYTGPEGTANVGLCRGGRRVCELGAFTACQDERTPQAEICDSLDNDCDGLADDEGGCACRPGESRECYSGPRGTSGVGICRSGTQVCADDGLTHGPCEGQTTPRAEICDGLDNDCDGRADDDVEGVGVECEVGVGGCAVAGETLCDADTGTIRCGARPRAPEVESCNAVDDDCDGAVDDGLGLGDPCVVGVGACRAQGDHVCDGFGSVTCDAVPSAPRPELCNGADDDCDGEADDGLGLGDVCHAGVGACAAEGRNVCADDGRVVCTAVPEAPGAESCNGIDDDCDGEADEDNAGGGAACALDLAGVCARGALFCVGAELVCRQTVQPSDEACNGLDDDCDGTVDVDAAGRPLSEPCYEGPPGTEGEGVCRAGARECGHGDYGACAGQVVPTAEICDSLDNDCDGDVDNLADGGRCACQPGTERDCYSGPLNTRGVGACTDGVQRCNEDGRSYGPCVGETTPAPESCDGVDNDCSGRQDDGVAGVGAECAVGVGACRARGQTFCDGDAGEVRCGAIAGEPRPEVCNMVDDDCDGTVDDGLGLGDACNVGVGACQRAGRLVCDGRGGVTCSAQPGMPGAETCNAVDDDCDGTVDDGLGLGDACFEGVGACRRDGRRICGAQGQVVCSARAGDPAAEACDRIDNNCNGEVDEGNPGGGQQCDTGAQGECARGLRICRDGGFLCQQQVQPQPEACDGRDNDCDGTRDEADNGRPLSLVCYTGPPATENVGLCRAGAQTCEGGRYGACVGQIVPAVEICDRLDNDCNNRVDDLPGGQMCACQPGTQRQCYSGPAGTQNVGVCRSGTQACLADGTGYGACQGEVLPQGETCNGRDDDCDGTTDDVPGAGDVCTPGVGACRREGRLACDVQTGALACSVQPGAPQPEVCNSVDDDCDGSVDDVPRVGEACSNGVGACLRPGNLVCDVVRQSLACNAIAGEPGREVCNGTDDDCNGQVDDGQLPGTGGDCSVGVGDCARSGVNQCRNGAIACSAVAGVPRPEVCDGRDNDCDGPVDDAPGDVGEACSVGVGACLRQGNSLCQAGREVCSVVAGAPSRELCDQVDNDCDGTPDDGLVCVVYRTCLEALNAGHRTSGIYRLSPDGRAAAVNVYCDQTTDGGGWTLVGSTLGSTLNDEASVYYADLLTLAPTQANTGIWNGLRTLPGAHTFDVRFACREQPGAEGAPMSVDLSFYETPWYLEMTAGNDAASCFSEDTGRGQDLPQPSRRVNASVAIAGRPAIVAGTFLPEGTPWDAEPGTIYENDTYLEGEDSCDATADFTVDLRDRGMDSNQGDGTDWGEDDGTLKCGRNALATGQWFVYAREDRVQAGSYLVSDGPAWGGAGVVSYTCQEACAIRFGGHASAYECSTAADRINRRAFASGWGDGQYCAGEGVADDFKLGGAGGIYNCGQAGCSYSAYVSDHCGAASRNYCWRRRAEFDAVEQNLATTVLTGAGFTPCYTGTYGDAATTMATIRANCDGNVLVMGCRPAPTAANPNPPLTVAAMGYRDEVYRDVGAAADAMHFHNYVNWYFSASESWGFAPYGYGVSRNTCDTRNGANDQGAQRLCWHTQANVMEAGWRCGATTGQFGVTWQRVVYERSGNLLPTPEPIIF